MGTALRIPPSSYSRCTLGLFNERFAGNNLLHICEKFEAPFDSDRSLSGYCLDRVYDDLLFLRGEKVHNMPRR